MWRTLSVFMVLVLTIVQQPSKIQALAESKRFDKRTIAEANRTTSALDTAVTLGAQPSSAELTISIWNDLNAMCRGGSGDRPETEYACCVRNNLGYCYHTGDTWRKCGPRDRRASAVALTTCVK
jgi:hypothetical protein